MKIDMESTGRRPYVRMRRGTDAHEEYTLIRSRFASGDAYRFMVSRLTFMPKAGPGRMPLAGVSTDRDGGRFVLTVNDLQWQHVTLFGLQWLMDQLAVRTPGQEVTLETRAGRQLRERLLQDRKLPRTASDARTGQAPHQPWTPSDSDDMEDDFPEWGMRMRMGMFMERQRRIVHTWRRDGRDLCFEVTRVERVPGGAPLLIPLAAVRYPLRGAGLSVWLNDMEWKCVTMFAVQWFMDHLEDGSPDERVVPAEPAVGRLMKVLRSDTVMQPPADDSLAARAVAVWRRY